MIELTPTAIPLDPLALLLQALPQQPQEAPPESELPPFEMILGDLLTQSEKPAIKAPEQPPRKEASKDVSLADILPVAFPNVIQFVTPDAGFQPVPTEEAAKPAGIVNDCALPPDLEEEIPSKPIAAAPPRLDLEQYDLKKIEFKLVSVDVAPEKPPPQVLRIVVPPSPQEQDEPAAEKPLPDAPRVAQQEGLAGPHSQHLAIARAEPVQHIRAFVEPPPPPPVARQISMDVGEADSQVRIVIRESNGGLEVRFDAANDRLRQDLQTASPLLVNQIERESRLHVVDLDFTSFGSATDSDRRDQPHARSKKNVKPEAVFADVDETTYLDATALAAKSL